MVKPVGLERRHFEGTLQAWLDTDAQGAWRPSPDVSCGWDKGKHDRIWYLHASAASAYITWLRRNGRAHEAAEVQWRFVHGAPVPPFKPETPSGVRIVPLPNQPGLFDSVSGT
jgi:hypothetical protein